MKKFHKLYIITIISLCVCVFQLSAQDIEGVLLGTVVDAEFIQQKFGQDYSKGVKEDLFGRWDVYVYGKDSLFVDNHCRLIEVVLSSDRFAVNTNEVPGGITVGQDVNVLLSANLDFCHLGERENSIYMEVPVFCTLGWYKLNERREICTIIMYEHYGDDVDGIGYGQKVSPELVISKFGEPSEIKTEDYWDAPMTIYVYYDGELKTYFAFTAEFRMMDYSIGSPRFKTFTDSIPGGLRVGDPIEKASTLFGPNGRWLNEWVDDYPYLEVENGVVKRIEYYISD